MKKYYFGTNLKMYKNMSETKEFLTLLEKNTQDISREDMELFVIPSFTSLQTAVTCTNQEFIKLGAQNMNWEEQGQFTGDISPLMIQELGLDLVMIGHSERRHVFGESDFEENKKVLAALKHGFTALLCIGETGEEKEYGISCEILRQQLIIGFHDVDPSYIGKIMVAYEPVWSIGVNGVPATAEYAQEMHVAIKECLKEIFGDLANEIPVLYGGSVNPKNAVPFFSQDAIDGLFIGRSAWDADNFNDIIRMVMDK